MKELIEQFQQGSTAAFEQLIKEYQQPIFVFCYYMLGNRQEAEDTVQEVFIKAYEHAHQYRKDQSFQAWLYQIAKNHCRNLLAKKKRYSLLSILLPAASSVNSAENQYTEKMSTELAYWLEGLSFDDKQLLLLRVLEDKSFEEISEILELKPSTLRKRFQRLKKKLQQKKERQENLHERFIELR